MIVTGAEPTIYAEFEPISVLQDTAISMRRPVKERMRVRIRARLDELGMTSRELAQKARPGESDLALDSWISGILTGVQALSWKHFDAVCSALSLSPSDLVREDDSTLRELTPTEMALLRHYQQWPTQIQERWLRLLDYFSASLPDPESAKFLDEVRELSLVDRRLLRQYLSQLRHSTRPQTPEFFSGTPEALASAGERRTTRPTGRSQTRPDTRGDDDDRDPTAPLRPQKTRK
jgi:hypothetical protein